MQKVTRFAAGSKTLQPADFEEPQVEMVEDVDPISFKKLESMPNTTYVSPRSSMKKIPKAKTSARRAHFAGSRQVSFQEQEE